METLEVSALEQPPTLAVAEGLSMTSLMENSVAQPTETSCLMNGDLSKLAQRSPKFYFQSQFSISNYFNHSDLGFFCSEYILDKKSNLYNNIF